MLSNFTLKKQNKFKVNTQQSTYQPQMENKLLVEQFSTTTNTSVSDASHYLSAAGWDFKKAIAIFVLVTLPEHPISHHSQKNLTIDYNPYLKNYECKPNPCKLKHISRLNNSQQEVIIEETALINTFIEEKHGHCDHDILNRSTQTKTTNDNLESESEKIFDGTCTIPFLNSKQDEERILTKEKENQNNTDMILGIEKELGYKIKRKRKNYKIKPKSKQKPKTNPKTNSKIKSQTPISKLKLKKLLNGDPTPSWYERFEYFKEYDPTLINNWPDGLKNSTAITLDKQFFDIYCELNPNVKPKNLHRGMTYFFERHGLTNNSKFSRSKMTFSKNTTPKKQIVRKRIRKRIVIKSGKKII
ncbi:hypothetical protein M0812_09113 [Anaeramoeba flamelloides]|uniref:Uncharacterized protein n=1 Tax=Anaeramoeba flamelloides TaxID=1746091 RepID=A0AAV7ZMR1_9EUKA|nr:hypothetical protein M0812_09113 [Anaeramoeba flamelloides]